MIIDYLYKCNNNYTRHKTTHKLKCIPDEVRKVCKFFIIIIKIILFIIIINNTGNDIDNKHIICES